MSPLVAFLYDQEWEFLVNMIYRLNSLDDISQFQSVCLEQLRVLIPNKQSLFLLDDRKEARIFSHSPVHVSTNNSDFNEEFFNRNIFRRTCQEYYFEHKSHAFRISDVIGDKNWSEMPLYNTIYKPLDIYYSLKIILIHNDCLLGDISLYRQKDDEDFSLRDLRISRLVEDSLAMKLFYLRKGITKKKNNQNNHFRFTYRECEVMKLLSEGKTDSEICQQLFISLNTLKNHIHNIYHKTGAKNRVQLLFFTEECINK